MSNSRFNWLASEGTKSTKERSKNMRNSRFNWLAPAALFMLTIAIIIAMIAALPGTVRAADPGINQPGAAGNVGRDPGVNQPGAAGNVGAGVDPGINQPGAAGNVGRDPGVNQPGAAGNRGGIRR
jgi:hypothetical protein